MPDKLYAQRLEEDWSTNIYVGCTGDDQFGRESFGRISDEEIAALNASLMGAGEGIVRFALFEFLTGEVWALSWAEKACI